MFATLALISALAMAQNGLPETETRGPDTAAIATDSAAVAGPADSLPVYRVPGVTVIATRAPLSQALAPASVSVIEPDPAAPSVGPAAQVSASVGVVPGAYGGPGSILSLSLRGSSSTV